MTTTSCFEALSAADSGLLMSICRFDLRSTFCSTVSTTRFWNVCVCSSTRFRCAAISFWCWSNERSSKFTTWSMLSCSVPETVFKKQ